MAKRSVHMCNVVTAQIRAGGDLGDPCMYPSGLKQGDTCSPLLFSLFINELAKDIVQRGRHGIQRIPDLTEIVLLMFADDVILMSNSVGGLQNQWNIPHETAVGLGLVVNLDKSTLLCSV